MFDWTQIAADLAAIVAENSTSIVIRRGGSTLAAQDVRIARNGRASVAESAGAQESRGRVVVMGGVDLDIAPGDRFNDGNGVLYRVVMVRPNRLAAVVAEAEVVG